MSAAVDYRPMWSALGLDLEKHNLLLGALGQMYQSTFLSQPNRPEGMKYFDFVMSEVHGLRIKELVDAKQQGRIVVGSYCVFVPEELILAVDGISVGLCAGAEFGVDQAEKYLPRNTCALIKSAFGFLLEKVCPYLAAADLVVGENTCDGKKKAYETLRQLLPRFHGMDLPQTKSDAGRAVLRAEYRKFVEALEKLSGRELTAANLRRAIDVVNRKREALFRLAMLRRRAPAAISGLDGLLAWQVSFYDDPVRFTASVNKLCDELELRLARGEGVTAKPSPRIVVSGCPMAVPNWKLHSLVEAAGATIVGEESCVGERGLRNPVDASGADLDALLEAVVDRYLKIDCAIFTPNAERLEHIAGLAAETQAAGVIHYALQFCTPYQMESIPVERQLERRGLPTLRVETDYSAEDAGPLRTRVEAFLERVGAKA